MNADLNSHDDHCHPEAAQLLAAKDGDVPSLRRLLRSGSLRVNYRCSSDGSMALYWAACNGHVVACDWLIRHSADVNLTTEKSGSAPLHGAADRGHADCVHLLLKRGADVTLRTKNNGDTPLHLAAYRGHVDVCRLLLVHGACSYTLNKQGRTPIQEAQIKSHYEVFRLITKYRSDELKELENNSRSLSSSCDFESFKRPGPIENAANEQTINETNINSSNNTFDNDRDDDDANDLRRHIFFDEIMKEQFKEYDLDRADAFLSRDSSWLKFATRTRKSSRISTLVLPDDKTSRYDDKIGLSMTDELRERQDDREETTRTMSKESKNEGRRDEKEKERVRTEEFFLRGLIRRLGMLTEYIEDLQMQLTFKDNRLGELTLEKEALETACRKYELEMKELDEERRINSDLRQQIEESRREMALLRKSFEEDGCAKVEQKS